MIEQQTYNNKIYSVLSGKYFLATKKEILCQDTILKLIHEYGYYTEIMSEKIKKLNDISLKDYIFDIAVFISKEDCENKINPYIVVECRNENNKIKLSDYLTGYINAQKSDSKYFIIRNNKEMQCFDVVKEIDYSRDFGNVPIPKPFECNINKNLLNKGDINSLIEKSYEYLLNNNKISDKEARQNILKAFLLKYSYEMSVKGKTILTPDQYVKDEIFYELNVRPNLKDTINDISYLNLLTGKDTIMELGFSKDFFNNLNFWALSIVLKILDNINLFGIEKEKIIEIIKELK